MAEKKTRQENGPCPQDRIASHYVNGTASMLEVRSRQGREAGGSRPKLPRPHAGATNGDCARRISYQSGPPPASPEAGEAGLRVPDLAPAVLHAVLM